VEIECRSAVAKVHAYVDSIMSTKLFGIDTNGTIIRQSYKHGCIKRKPGMPELWSIQDLRNLKFSYGELSFKGDNIAKCWECEKTFLVETLVENVLSKHFGSHDELIPKMRLAVKQYSSKLYDQDTTTSQ
jgi:hypothetical protein